MEQYIPKSALVAEIEKLEELYCYGKSDGMLIAKSVFDSTKNIINTLEVKEVDLEKENLTWQDVGLINEIVNIILGECEDKILYDTEEEFCKEVLKRFKAQKGE